MTSQPGGGPDDPNDLVVGAVLRASRALVAVSSRSLAEVEDALTMTQFRTLVVLVEDGSVSLGHLARRLDVAPSTALRTVDRLVALELVTRAENSDDRRQVVITPSEAGRRVVAEVTTRRRREIARAVERMTAPTEDLVHAFDDFAHAVDTPAHPEDPKNRRPTPTPTPTSLGW